MVPQLKVHFFTISNKNVVNLNFLLYSGRKNGIGIEPLGLEHVGEWKNIYKMMYLKKRLEKNDIDSNDLVVVLDAFDTIIIGNPLESLKNYLNMKYDIVFGASDALFPMTHEIINAYSKYFRINFLPHI